LQRSDSDRREGGLRDKKIGKNSLSIKERQEEVEGAEWNRFIKVCRLKSTKR
jgi:hypothetical protein